MVSAHHEMRYKHVDNMVLLLVHHRSMTPQEAVDHCCQLIRDDYLAFESVESNILSLATIHEMVDTARLFITCCKDVRIGLVNWTYAGGLLISQL
ncbi:hypothetical protein N7492_008408 [Penicillium capsulatum]|uniref:Uncharacterized protein n=1 Tax=Penicillium capsulatum TaxID=69766 RepID=A0A9W9LH98_9EURO|nr:hypothetical protein N7492_008408 [Penicillium capsulatum]KAJ6105810.1 hypothetical protein N7512_009327 [Penicillium capsulatum]